MDIKVTSAKIDQIEMVQNLARFYIYDMSEFMGWRCPETGLFGGCDDFFDDWKAGKNAPFLISVCGELAGFAGVKPLLLDGIEGHCVQEFFILRKFRRKGLGQSVAIDLFGQFPGEWLVQYFTDNLDAAHFWPRVVSDCTTGVFTTIEEINPAWGKMASIRFSTA